MIYGFVDPRNTKVSGQSANLSSVNPSLWLPTTSPSLLRLLRGFGASPTPAGPHNDTFLRCRRERGWLAPAQKSRKFLRRSRNYNYLSGLCGMQWVGTREKTRPTPTHPSFFRLSHDQACPSSSTWSRKPRGGEKLFPLFSIDLFLLVSLGFRCFSVSVMGVGDWRHLVPSRIILWDSFSITRNNDFNSFSLIITLLKNVEIFFQAFIHSILIVQYSFDVESPFMTIL